MTFQLRKQSIVTFGEFLLAFCLITTSLFAQAAPEKSTDQLQSEDQPTLPQSPSEWLPREFLAELPSDAEGLDAATSSFYGERGLAKNYIIGPEDVLDIEVFNLPELSKTVRVANDGTISLALLGHVTAQGLTTTELGRVLEDKWGETYLQNPQVTVFVREHHARPVSVIGAVERPGMYQLTGPRTLVEVLSMAGGLAKRTSAPAGRTVYVTRKSGFESLPATDGARLVAADKLEIDLRKLLYSEQSDLNISIRPFDIVSVTKADVVYVVGDVKRPGGFVLEDRENVTVLQALALAEGLTGTAAKGAARIIRTSSEGQRVEIPVDLGKVLGGKARDPVMMANDILFVPNSTAKSALKRGAEATLGTISGILIYRR